MVFFDDEYRNIEEVGKYMGVHAQFVKNGITLNMVLPFLK
ncbi:MAG: hypothetical protein IPF54_07995 [Draconibacterium sp.]|nr:hypothetical protein [Draconibacterium sp.]